MQEEPIQKETLQLLQEIKDNLVELNLRDEVQYYDENLEKKRIEQRVVFHSEQIQATFDRIHDKVFHFNNVLIAAYLVLGTFPSNAPVLKLWTAIFPIMNLIFIVFLEIRQIEIHRFCANELNWSSDDYNKIEKKQDTQTKLSIIGFVLSLGCLGYLISALF